MTLDRTPAPMNSLIRRTLPGLLAGLLAMGLYAAKPGAAEIQRVNVLSLKRDIPLGTAVQHADLITSELVPAEVAAEFIAAADCGSYTGRRPLVALKQGQRLSPWMFADNGIQDVPEGFRSVELADTRDLPVGIHRGSQVDLMDRGRTILEAAVVVGLEPLTVAVPEAEVGSLTKVRSRVVVAGRPEGRSPVMPPAAPAAHLAPPSGT
ncbi:MAG: hypothetical protein ABIO70_23325 [Pseudomonadota bacterium]